MQPNSAKTNIGSLPKPLPTIQLRAPRVFGVTSIVVSPPGCDDMGAVLQSLGFPSLQAPDIESFKAALPSARIVFLNCCGVPAESGVVDGLRKCLRNGGVVFASDYTADCLQALQIQDLGFHLRAGVSGTVEAHLIDPELKAVVGRKSVEINFDFPDWVLVKDLPACARVLLRADVKLEEPELGSRELHHQPLAFTTPTGPGSVIFTSFHNRAQTTEMEKALLSSLAIKTIATATGKTMQQVISNRGLSRCFL